MSKFKGRGRGKRECAGQAAIDSAYLSYFEHLEKRSGGMCIGFDVLGVFERCLSLVGEMEDEKNGGLVVESEGAVQLRTSSNWDHAGERPGLSMPRYTSSLDCQTTGFLL